MHAPATAPAILAGFEPLSRRYDAILCDVWGVLHNGVKAYAAAGEALTRFREGGGRVVLVSNAPRPGRLVGEMLDRFGVPRTAYDGVVTSGDLTREAVEARGAEVVHHIGPERDLPLFEGLAARLGPIEEAAYVVCSGLDDDERETAEDYRGRLERIRARGLPMICANPDIVVERGHELLPCAGAVAALYEEMGGEVYYPGKPHRPVYEAAVARAEGFLGRSVPRDRVLAIGDAIRTDVAGARAYGIDALLLARGIHAAELGVPERPLEAARVEAWLDRQAARPTYVMDVLVWGRAEE